MAQDNLAKSETNLLSGFDPGAQDALTASANLTVAPGTGLEPTREDALRMAFRDDYARQEARDRYLTNPDGTMRKDGRMLYAHDVLEAVSKGIYRPTSLQGMAEVVMLAEHWMRGGVENEATMKWSLSPSPEERGMDARYNYVVQLLDKAKERGNAIENALMTDELWRLDEAGRTGEDVSGNAFENLLGLSARFNTDRYQWFDFQGMRSVMKAPDDRYASLNAEFGSPSFSPNSFGAGLFSGGRPMFSAEAGFGDLKVVPREEADFDFANAERTETKFENVDRLIDKDGKPYETIDGYYLTAKGEDGEERVAIPFPDDRWMVTTRGEVAELVRRTKYSAELASERNEPYRKLVQMQIRKSLSPTGLAWLDRNAKNGSLLERDTDGTWVTQISNVVGNEEADRFLALSQTDKDKLRAILQMGKPSVAADGWWQTVGYHIVRGFGDLTTSTWRGTARIWATLSMPDGAERDKYLARMRVKDEMNALAEVDIEYDADNPWMRYSSIGAESIPGTAAFFVGGEIGALAKVGTRLAKAARLGTKGQKVVEKVLSHAPLAVTQTLAGYEESMHDLVLRCETDEQLRNAIAGGTWANVATGFVGYLGEYLPVAYGTRAVKRAAVRTRLAVGAGSRKAALREGAAYWGRSFLSVAAAEATQEVSQQMAQTFVQGVIDAALDYKAKHGDMEGFGANDVPWDDIVYDVGAGVLPSLATSVGITAMTQGLAGVKLTGEVNRDLNRVIEKRRIDQESDELRNMIRARREAQGVHYPAWEKTVEPEIEAAISAKRKELNRELTDEEVAEIEEDVKDRVAMGDLHRLYSEWVTTTDETKKKKLLTDIGLSDVEVTRFENLFRDLFAFSHGQQWTTEIAVNAASLKDVFGTMGITAKAFTDVENGVEIDWGNGKKTRVEVTSGDVSTKNKNADGVFINLDGGTKANATDVVNAIIRIQSTSAMGSTHLIGHELGHNILQIARDGGVLTDAQKAELAQLFQKEDGTFDEEQFAEAFARELKFALTKAQNQRAEKAPETRIGRALRPIVDFFVALATSVRNWRVGRGMDAETGAPLQAQSVLEAFLQRQREEAKAQAEINRRRWEQSKKDGAALAEALERSPHQIVLDDDGTPLKFHDPKQVTKHDGIGEDVLDALNEMLITQGDARLYSKELGDVLLSFGRFADPEHRFNGKGVLHIIEERMRPDKDNLTLDEAVEVVLKVAEAATRGKIIERQGNRYGIELNGYKAVIADNGSFREIITGYKIGKGKRSGVETDAIRRSEDYAPDFYGRLRVEGAERLRNRIAKLLEGRQVEKSVEALEAELSALDDENWDLLTAFNRAKRAGDQQEIDVAKQALDDNEAKLKATEEALAKARKKRNQRIAKAKKRGDYSGHPEQYHTKVYTAARKGYVRPSMAFVGTGVGGRNEGYGLYGSGEEAFAMNEYAKAYLENKERWEERGGKLVPPKRPAVVTQIWFTNREEGDESHLLTWDQPVSEENFQRAAMAAKDAGATQDELDDLGEVGYTGADIYNWMVDFFYRHGETKLADKAASEALYAHDIDGIKYAINREIEGHEDGRDGWNYVAFSDEHMVVVRIDEWNNKTKQFETTYNAEETDDFEQKWHDPAQSSAAEAERARAEINEVRRQYEGTEQWMKAPNGEPTKLNERQWLQVRTPSFKAWFGDWENDPANASKVVDENGEPMVVYHGSKKFGFSVFDPSFSDDRISIFTSDSERVAQSYANLLARLRYIGLNDSVRYSPGKVLDAIFDNYDASTVDQVANMMEMIGDVVEVDYKFESADESDAGEESVVLSNRFGNELRLDDSMSGMEIEAALREWLPNAAKLERLVSLEDAPEPGIYALYMRLNNPLVIDAEGSDWSTIKTRIGELHGLSSTRDIAKFAKAHGYDGVIVRNIIDQGAGTFGLSGDEASTVVINFTGRETVKSAIENRGTFNPSHPDIRFHLRSATEKVQAATRNVTRDVFAQALEEEVRRRVERLAIHIRDGRDDDVRKIVEAALRFYDLYAEKVIVLSNGMCVYFAPALSEARLAELSRELGREATDVDKWVEYAIHAVTNDTSTKTRRRRSYQEQKNAGLEAIEEIIRQERVLGENRQAYADEASFVFVGEVGGRIYRVVTRLDDDGNADLREVTVVPMSRDKKVPPTIPLSEAVEKRHQGAGYSPSTKITIAQSGGDVKPGERWHDPAAGGVPEFTETPLGQELVARAFDAIVGSRVDLLLRPSRYYGSPYEGGGRRPQDALLVERLNRDVDVSTPEGFAAEVSAEISRFGTREGDPTLREIRARCGNKRNFYAVLGAVYETAENLRNGLGNVVTDREHAMMKNAGLAAADFIKHNATARATALGRKAYIAGRNFAKKLYAENAAKAREVAAAKVREEIGKRREAERAAATATAEAQKQRTRAGRAEFSLADERFLREYERAQLRHEMAMKVDALKEKMAEEAALNRVREARKRAVERERGVTFTYLKGSLGVDIPERLRDLAGSSEDLAACAEALMNDLDAGFDKWAASRRELFDGTEPYLYLNAQGERAYAETMANVLKAIARELSYGKLRESLLNAADAIVRSKRDTVRASMEGKIMRVTRVLRAAHNADVVKLATRRVKSVLAEANRRLSSEASSVRTRYMTSMRKTAKELLKTFAMAVDAQRGGDDKKTEKRRAALQAERDRLAAELSLIDNGQTPDNLAKDERLTERQHKDAMKLMFLEKFGDLSYTLDPADVWAKAAEAEAFVRDALFEHVLAWEAKKAAAAEMARALMDALGAAAGDTPQGTGWFGALVPSWFDRMRWPLSTAAGRDVISRFERLFAQAALDEARWNREDDRQIKLLVADAYGIEGKDEAERERKAHAKWLALQGDYQARWADELSLDGKTLSRSNLIYLYAALRQEDVREKMAHNYDSFAETGEDGRVIKKGIDVYLERLEAELTAGDLALADKAVEFFAKKRAPLSTVAARLFGLAVYSPSKNYVPLSVELENGPVGQKGPSQFVLFPNFLKNRVWHSRKIDETMTINRVLRDRSMEQNRWMAYAELFQLGQLVFNNPDVAAQYEHALGTKNMRELKKQWNEMFIGLEMSTSTGTKFMRSGAALLGLGWNVRSSVRQLEGLAAWAVDVGVSDTVGCLIDALKGIGTKEWLARWKAELNSETVRNRMENGSLLEQRQALAFLEELTVGGKRRGKKEIAILTALQKYSNAAFTPLKLMDALACTWVMVGLRPKLEEKWRRLGENDANARKLANQEIDVMVQRLQQSGRPEYLNSWQRGNWMTQLATMFTGPASMSAGVYVSAFHDLARAIKSGDATLRKAAVTRICGTLARNFVYGLLTWLTGGIYTGDADDEDKDAIAAWSTALTTVFGGLTGMVLVGAAVNTSIKCLSQYLGSHGETKPDVLYDLGKFEITMPAIDTLSRSARKMLEGATELADSDYDAEDIATFLFTEAEAVVPALSQGREALEAVGLVEEKE